MQEQQEKIPNGQRGADSAGPTARGRQRGAGPVWPITARSSARPQAAALRDLLALVHVATKLDEVRKPGAFGAAEV